MRLMPGWETRAFGYSIPNPFYPGVLIPGITFTLLYLWPFIEARRTGDHAEHHVLDRPRDRPNRTALGVATLVFYSVLGLAGANDVLTVFFGLSINQFVWMLRIMLLVAPIAAGLFTRKVCLDLQERERRVAAAHAEHTSPAAAAAGGGGGGGGG